MPNSPEVWIEFETDCDGPSIAYHDISNAEQIHSTARPDCIISREDFMEHIFPMLDDWHKGYWEKVGYYNDSSAIRNCELGPPGAMETLDGLKLCKEIR